MVAGSFVVSVLVFVGLGATRPRRPRAFIQTLFDWLPAGVPAWTSASSPTPLSITMCLFVTGVAALIHLYSIGYMHGDPRFSKFFVYLNLFVFSMLMLVLGDNLLVTFLGLGGRGRVLLPAHLVLAREGRERHGRQEGLRHQPDR